MYLLLVHPDATLEEIAEVIESGEAERIFADHVVQREQAAKQALSYIRVKKKLIYVLCTYRICLLSCNLGSSPRDRQDRT